MFDPGLDMTMVSVPGYERRLPRDETGPTDRPLPGWAETGFAVLSAASLGRQATAVTPTAAELEVAGPLTEAVAVVATIERAREDRIALLARKYENPANESVEEAARLKILTERLRKLNPRVEQRDFDQLTEMVGDLEAGTAELEEIRQKFGLR